ncbi:hypothetical protein [Stenotrophomonas sp. CFBP 13718]|uniref:hypothetical protein n=1 Tax=Stenotrophomonas sp. CFBP 13718 TaxID=2775304 RepID=UPI00177B62AF|nr:hypothetical protein [Stenotrophomonas sp. CFBP 13718]MBD8696849.1 hypothetical protein [Stenotrophomonas sp. CFBP 13718]
MEFPSKELWTAIGTVIAATVAAGVTFLTATLSKDAKISDFRLAWMDTVRAEIAEISSRCLHIQASSKRLRAQGTAEPQIHIEFAEDMLSIKRNIAMLRMRLDPNKHQSVIYLLTKVDNKEWSERTLQTGSTDLLTEFQEEGRILLFTEWQRVKKGEGAYRIFRPLSKYMFLFLLIALGIMATVAISEVISLWN